MTIEETINQFVGLSQWLVWNGNGRKETAPDTCKVDNESVQRAIEALEKQLPKEVINKMDGKICPVCNTVLYNGMKYCSECGQRIKSEIKDEF